MQVAMHFIKFLCSVKPTKMGLFDVLASGILKPVNSVLGFMGIQGMCIPTFGKWA